MCEVMWGREDGSPRSGSAWSDATSADALLAPTSSADGSGVGTGFDVLDESDEVADVSDWTHDQVSNSMATWRPRMSIQQYWRRPGKGLGAREGAGSVLPAKGAALLHDRKRTMNQPHPFLSSRR